MANTAAYSGLRWGELTALVNTASALAFFIVESQATYKRVVPL
jgi:hypothetical protein